MNYNPYDLVPLLIDGVQMQGRPFAFDSDVVNQKTMENAFGAFVKPIKAMTMCPVCSQGFEVQLSLGEPPFEPFLCSCPRCHPAPPPLVDPFVNPVKTGRVSTQELDPILHNPTKPLPATVGTVADRFEAPAIQQSLKAQRPPKVQKPPKPPKTKELKAEPATNNLATTPNRGRATEIQRADGVDEEQDFDDSEMVE